MDLSVTIFADQQWGYKGNLVDIHRDKFKETEVSSEGCLSTAVRESRVSTGIFKVSNE